MCDDFEQYESIKQDIFDKILKTNDYFKEFYEIVDRNYVKFNDQNIVILKCVSKEIKSSIDFQETNFNRKDNNNNNIYENLYCSIKVHSFCFLKPEILNNADIEDQVFNNYNNSIKRLNGLLNSIQDNYILIENIWLENSHDSSVTEYLSDLDINSNCTYTNLYDVYYLYISEYSPEIYYKLYGLIQLNNYVLCLHNQKNYINNIIKDNQNIFNEKLNKDVNKNNNKVDYNSLSLNNKQKKYSFSKIDLNSSLQNEMFLDKNFTIQDINKNYFIELVDLCIGIIKIIKSLHNQDLTFNNLRLHQIYFNPKEKKIYLQPYSIHISSYCTFYTNCDNRNYSFFEDETPPEKVIKTIDKKLNRNRKIFNNIQSKTHSEKAYDIWAIGIIIFKILNSCFDIFKNNSNLKTYLLSILYFIKKENNDNQNINSYKIKTTDFNKSNNIDNEYNNKMQLPNLTQFFNKNTTNYNYFNFISELVISCLNLNYEERPDISYVFDNIKLIKKNIINCLDKKCNTSKNIKINSEYKKSDLSNKYKRKYVSKYNSSKILSNNNTKNTNNVIEEKQNFYNKTNYNFKEKINKIKEELKYINNEKLLYKNDYSSNKNSILPKSKLKNLKDVDSFWDFKENNQNKLENNKNNLNDALFNKNLKIESNIEVIKQARLGISNFINELKERRSKSKLNNNYNLDFNKELNNIQSLKDNIKNSDISKKDNIIYRPNEIYEFISNKTNINNMQYNNILEYTNKKLLENNLSYSFRKSSSNSNLKCLDNCDINNNKAAKNNVKDSDTNRLNYEIKNNKEEKVNNTTNNILTTKEISNKITYNNKKSENVNLFSFGECNYNSIYEHKKLDLKDNNKIVEIKQDINQKKDEYNKEIKLNNEINDINPNFTINDSKDPYDFLNNQINNMSSLLNNFNK